MPVVAVVFAVVEEQPVVFVVGCFVVADVFAAVPVVFVAGYFAVAGVLAVVFAAGYFVPDVPVVVSVECYSVGVNEPAAVFVECFVADAPVVDSVVCLLVVPVDVAEQLVVLWHSNDFRLLYLPK